MKKFAILFLCYFVAIGRLFAWGEGHIVHCNLVLDYLPKEISAFLKKDSAMPPQKWVKFPDGMAKHSAQEKVLNALGKDEVAFIENCASSQYFWHHDNAKCMAYILLAKAIRENDSKKASFYFGVLMHSIADMSALNHGPLLHYLTFFKYNPTAFPDIDLDLRVYNDLPELRNATTKKLAIFKPEVLPNDISQNIAQLYMQSAFDSAFLSKIENKIAVYQAGKKYSDSYIETFSQLIDYQVRQGVNITCSAWALGKSNTPLNPKDFLSADMKKVVLPKSAQIQSKRILMKLAKQRKLSDDSVFSGLCDDSKLPAIAFIVEKSGVMDRSAIGLKTKFLAAISARHLKKTGKNIRLIDIVDLKNTDLSPKNFPVLVISDLTGERFKKYIEPYVQQGGKILIMGGQTANFAGLQNLCKTRPNHETPVSTKWGVVNKAEIKKMSLHFKNAFAPLVKNEVPFERNPNVIGWYKPISNIEILPSENVVAFVDLKYGDAQQSYCVSAGFKNSKGEIYAIWLPQYLLMPTLFSNDTLQMQDWSKPTLDSFSAPIFEKCIDILQN